MRGKVKPLFKHYVSESRQYYEAHKDKADYKPETLTDLILASVPEITPDFEEAVVDEAGTFLVAGSDTTALFMTFMLFEIYSHP